MSWFNTFLTASIAPVVGFDGTKKHFVQVKNTNFLIASPQISFRYIAAKDSVFSLAPTNLSITTQQHSSVKGSVFIFAPPPSQYILIHIDQIYFLVKDTIHYWTNSITLPYGWFTRKDYILQDYI